MRQTCFHPSIEGAQHGAKSLTKFLDYAKKIGVLGLKLAKSHYLRAPELCAELEVKVVPMFRGVAFGGELPSDNPRRFWQRIDRSVSKDGQHCCAKGHSKRRTHASLLFSRGLVRLTTILAAGYFLTIFHCSAAPSIGGRALKTAQEVLPHDLPVWMWPSLALLIVVAGMLVTWKLVKTGFQIRVKTRKREFDLRGNGEAAKRDIG